MFDDEGCGYSVLLVRLVCRCECCMVRLVVVRLLLVVSVCVIRWFRCLLLKLVY